jgi:hypothetical protein
MTLIKNQSILTGAAACLFLAGVVLLFVVLFHEAMRGGALPWITGVVLVAAGACWAASARAGKLAPSGGPTRAAQTRACAPNNLDGGHGRSHALAPLAHPTDSTEAVPSAAAANASDQSIDPSVFLFDQLGQVIFAGRNRVGACNAVLARCRIEQLVVPCDDLFVGLCRASERNVAPGRLPMADRSPHGTVAGPDFGVLRDFPRVNESGRGRQHDGGSENRTHDGPPLERKADNLKSESVISHDTKLRLFAPSMSHVDGAAQLDLA